MKDNVINIHFEFLAKWKYVIQMGIFTRPHLDGWEEKESRNYLQKIFDTFRQNM